MVFLFLAAQYESWSTPLSVLLAVPLAMLGAATFLLLRGFDLNIYTQIGLVLLIGLAAKSAVMIVEFAKAVNASDHSPHGASGDRLDPIAGLFEAANDADVRAPARAAAAEYE